MGTLAQLRQRVRNNLGEPTVVTNGRFTNASIDNHVNEAYRQYQLELIENGEGNLLTKVFISIVANQEAYALPSDWVKTERLERSLTYGTIPLEYDKRPYATNPSYGITSGSWYLPTYRFRGKNLVLEPTPQFSETNGLVHEYAQLQPDLVADGGTPHADFLTPWHDLLVLYATIAELEGKEAIGGVADIETFRVRLVAMEQRFRDSMEGRTEQREIVEPYGQRYDDGWSDY